METDRYRRVLHLRHADGFSAEMFERFEAGCRLFRVHVETVLAEWQRFAKAGDERTEGEYHFHPPELSIDRLVASMAIDGVWTLGSRAEFENGSSHLLRRFFPVKFKAGLEEGLTESVAGEAKTYWRNPVDMLEQALASANPFSNSPIG